VNLQKYLQSKGGSLLVNNRTKDKPEVKTLLEANAQWIASPAGQSPYCTRLCAPFVSRSMQIICVRLVANGMAIISPPPPLPNPPSNTQITELGSHLQLSSSKLHTKSRSQGLVKVCKVLIDFSISQNWRRNVTLCSPCWRQTRPWRKSLPPFSRATPSLAAFSSTAAPFSQT